MSSPVKIPFGVQYTFAVTSEDEVVTLRATDWQLYVAQHESVAAENERLVAENKARVERARLASEAPDNRPCGWYSTPDAPAVIRFWSGDGWFKSRFVPGIPGDTFVGYRAARLFVWFFAFAYSLAAWLAVVGLAAFTVVTGIVVFNAEDIMLKVTALFPVASIGLVILFGWLGFKSYAGSFYLQYPHIIGMVVAPTVAIGTLLFISWLHLLTVANLVAPLFALILASAPFAILSQTVYWLVGGPQ